MTKKTEKNIDRLAHSLLKEFIVYSSVSSMKKMRIIKNEAMHKSDKLKDIQDVEIETLNQAKLISTLMTKAFKTEDFVFERKHALMSATEIAKLMNIDPETCKDVNEKSTPKEDTEDEELCEECVQIERMLKMLEKLKGLE